MFAYILHQIYNEKRSNWALLLELLIVSSIIWFLVDTVYVKTVCAMEPTGFDITNCYKIYLKQITSTASDYDPSHPDSADITTQDFMTLMNRVRQDDDVEYAAWSLGCEPYNGSSYSTRITWGDTTYLSIRIVTCEPDFFKVFRITGTDGKSSDVLDEMLTEGHVMLAPGLHDERNPIPDLLGRNVYPSGDSIPQKVVAKLPAIKRYRWEEAYNNDVLVVPLKAENLYDSYIRYFSIRVKAGRNDGFKERFMEKIKNKKMRAGNYYLSDVRSFEDIQYDSEAHIRRENRTTAVALGFMLLNVFLGLLGTFWFRTQRRFPEIGLQKAIGATNADITRRLFAEAVLLMTIAFIPSLVIDANLAHAELTQQYCGLHFEWTRFGICAAVTYVLMLAVIAFGIWFPALKAVKANPVEVLRGE